MERLTFFLAMIGYASSGTFSIPSKGSFMAPTATEWKMALEDIPYLVGWAPPKLPATCSGRRAPAGSVSTSPPTADTYTRDSR